MQTLKVKLWLLVAIAVPLAAAEPPNYVPLKTANYALGQRIVDATGGVLALTDNPDWTALANRLHRETGCRVAANVNVRYDVPADPAEAFAYRNAQYQRVRDQLRSVEYAELIIFNFEGGKADELLALVYRLAAFEMHPDAEVGFYHWPGSSLSHTSFARNRTVWPFDPPANVAVHNDYGCTQDGTAARWAEARKLADYRPSVVYLAGFCYQAVLRSDGTIGWHSVRGDYQDPETWYLRGQFYKSKNVRIVWWEFLGDHRHDFDTLERRVWQPFAAGLRGEPFKAEWLDAE